MAENNNTYKGGESQFVLKGVIEVTLYVTEQYEFELSDSPLPESKVE